eukprot:2522272-Rhodomonas_salina.1
MAIAHSEDINNDTIDSTKPVSVHRLRYRDHDRTLRMLENKDAHDNVRSLQDKEQLPKDMLITRGSTPYAEVMGEFEARIRNKDLMGKNSRRAAPRDGSFGLCARRPPPSATTAGHAGDMQSESDEESMSSIDGDERPWGRSNAWTNAEAEFDCDSGSDRSSP